MPPSGLALQTNVPIGSDGQLKTEGSVSGSKPSLGPYPALYLIQEWA